MIIRPVQLHDVPGVAVFHAPLRICLGEGHHAPDAKRVAQRLHGLGDALAYPHALAQRADDLVGIGLFQLVIPHVPTDEIMHKLFLLPIAQAHGRAGELLDAGGHGLLVLLNLALFKQVFRHHLHAGGLGIVPVGEAHGVENLRMIQPQLQKDFGKLPRLQPRHRKRGGNGPQPGEHGMVGSLAGFVQLIVIVSFHGGGSLLAFAVFQSLDAVFQPLHHGGFPHHRTLQHQAVGHCGIKAAAGRSGVLQ